MAMALEVLDLVGGTYITAGFGAAGTLALLPFCCN